MDISVYVKLEPNIASNERPDGLEPSKSKDATHLRVVIIICYFSMGHHSQDHSESTIFLSYIHHTEGKKIKKKKMVS